MNSEIVAISDAIQRLVQVKGFVTDSTGQVTALGTAADRLSRFFYMTTEYIQRVQVGGVTATTNSLTDFNVKLKARWEY